ncbi:hypothetical protein J40TS1_29640 [Paenibacillus montaniterrae]|uniref:Lipoprotein n=1 Tax=Paenibacillus montaniterrae TaxID=429341 RepID=A0A919YQ95_9BACL|nr:hypothetical protein [Paenibacillus montaniterrae]GIP17322.1 hypothetical protein J40TS1_29640 [Paenibacillus montaniterrae]
MIKKAVFFILFLILLIGCSSANDADTQIEIDLNKYYGAEVYVNHEDHIESKFLRGINDTYDVIQTLNKVSKEESKDSFNLQKWDYIVVLGEKLEPVNNNEDIYFAADSNKLVIFIQGNQIKIDDKFVVTSDNITENFKRLYEQFNYEPRVWEKY